MPREPHSPAPVSDVPAEFLEDFAVSEVIRPAAVLSETAARRVLGALALDPRWEVTPGVWLRNDTAGTHLGTLSCVYDTPSRYSVTVFRASITTDGVTQAWTVERLCDEAFGHADLTLAEVPRADLLPPPPPFRG